MPKIRIKLGRWTAIWLAAGAGLVCLPAQAQWGSIRGNNRAEPRGNSQGERMSRAPEVHAERGRNETRVEVPHEEHREVFSRPEVHEEHRGPSEWEHRRFDFDEDRRRGYFWSGIASGMLYNALPSGYVPITVGGSPYYYYDGAYYQQEPSGYMAVTPPIGAVVPALPPGSEPVTTPQGVFYYGAGAFYVQQPQGFQVIPPPLGATVSYLPPGATQVYLRGMVYYQAAGVYFMPVMQGGVTVYTVVQP